jgi:hypothetical protein
VGVKQGFAEFAKNHFAPEAMLFSGAEVQRRIEEIREGTEGV